jgi:hypothetical protein
MSLSLGRRAKARGHLHRLLGSRGRVDLLQNPCAGYQSYCTKIIGALIAAIVTLFPIHDPYRRLGGSPIALSVCAAMLVVRLDAQYIGYVLNSFGLQDAMVSEKAFY